MFQMCGRWGGRVALAIAVLHWIAVEIWIFIPDNLGLLFLVGFFCLTGCGLAAGLVGIRQKTRVDRLCAWIALAVIAVFWILALMPVKLTRN